MGINIGIRIGTPKAFVPPPPPPPPPPPDPGTGEGNGESGNSSTEEPVEAMLYKENVKPIRRRRSTSI